MKGLLDIMASPWRDADAGRRLGYGCAMPAALVAAMVAAALMEAL